MNEDLGRLNMSGRTVWIVGALVLAFSAAASAGAVAEAKRAISETNFITPVPVSTTPTDPTDDCSSDCAGDNQVVDRYRS
jgi:hypothetical protein